MSNRKFNEMVTKVRVTGGESSMWYSREVGEEYVVTRVDNSGDYHVEHPLEDDVVSYYIKGKDAEPVEIRYNGERYRLESRKAEVGEKVVVVNAEAAIDYGNGDIFEVQRVDDGLIDFTDNTGDRNSLYHSEYRVLVPVEPTASKLTANVTLDLGNSAKIIEMLTALSTEVAELKRNNDKLADYIRELNAKIIEMDYEIDAVKERKGEITVDAPKITIDTPVTAEEVAERVKKALEPLIGRPLAKPESTASSILETVRKINPTRADVVKRAQADVVSLMCSETYDNDRHPINLDGNREDFDPTFDEVDFVVNREKRTVVALLRYIDDKGVWAKGIAKCAPDDVFNADIGKAIALRRALGLSVPDEYLNAPAPGGVAVGDIVGAGSLRYTVVSPENLKRGENTCVANSVIGRGGIVIDDSDREEYRKGACC
jgi:hypothetical protein